MEEFYPYAIGAAAIALIAIIFNFRSQQSKMKGALKYAKNVPPVMLQESVERKLITLETTLYKDEKPGEAHVNTAGQHGEPAGGIANKRQLMIARLDELEKSYAEGTISMKAYDHHLRQLIMKLPQ